MNLIKTSIKGLSDCATLLHFGLHRNIPNFRGAKGDQIG
jgi:hypothetical protein